ncbi:hypothetical protein ACFYSC_05075 [Streptosporangium sp. NPDC004379]|uniref:hypothetical protein n=1 Tax=Streptosporangium sp. NPDC004379 TaxID=3366189 RepID=UPI0036A66E89
MPRVLLAVPAIGLALAALTGCGGPAATQAAATPSPSDATQNRIRQMESDRADCMKRKGFKYNMNVPPPKRVSDEKRKLDAGDYETMKRFRQKYGFKYFAEFVYPDDPAAAQYEIYDNTANQPIKNSLSATQLAAWGEADVDCRNAAIKKFTGKTVTSEQDYYDQLNRRLEQADRETDGDPKLIELARKYGECLRGKGYKVASLRPTKVTEAGGAELRAELNRLGREQAEDPVDGAEYQPKLTAAQARPYLDREIKAALDDLECGRDFYPAYAAGNKMTKAYDEFGHGVIQW